MFKRFIVNILAGILRQTGEELTSSVKEREFQVGINFLFDFITTAGQIVTDKDKDNNAQFKAWFNENKFKLATIGLIATGKIVEQNIHNKVVAGIAKANIEALINIIEDANVPAHTDTTIENNSPETFPGFTADAVSEFPEVAVAAPTKKSK